MSAVHLRKLSITLGGKAIIDALDLDVEAGEFLVLLGPSGCGKSTLLHAIAGLVDVAAGSVAIGGRDMTLAEPGARGIGMVFQSYALYPTMTVRENMGFGLKMAGTPKAEIARRVGQVAAMLQLDALLARKPSELSGGQRQRVAIGRALVREADVFLFDEPLSNLDAQLRAELRRELKLLHARLGSTMIYVTHDQVEAMTLASRIVVMQGGAVQQIGTPAQVYARPANRFVAGFLGAPSMNFIDGAVTAADAPDAPAARFQAGLLEVALSGRAACGPATLGVRPEHVCLEPGGALAARVTLVEPMGNHQVVWLDAGGQLLSSIVHDAASYAPGQAVRFRIDGAQVSLFDPVDGRRMQYASGYADQPIAALNE